MTFRDKFNHWTLAAVITISMSATVPLVAYAQNGDQNVSTVTLQVVPGAQGENVITPKGYSVPLPGAGVNSNQVHIYMGAQGGYWYVDRYGQTVDLTSSVAALRGQQGQPVQQVPQYAPVPQSSSSSSSSSSSGGSGFGTAAAAGLGAMTGAAIAGSTQNYPYYHGVPYGTPMYYPHGGGNPYYMNGGNQVNVEHNTNVNAANVNATNVKATNVNATNVITAVEKRFINRLWISVSCYCTMS